MSEQRIASPDQPELATLCQELARLAGDLEAPGAWPARQLELCGWAGVFEWFVPRQAGGQGWSEADILRGYLALAEACLTTTFVITQRAGACSRIAASDNPLVQKRLLPDLIRGRTFATVGISHLTTSRQHLAQPVLRASEVPGGFLLEGYSPWVTGAAYAQHIVVGATLEDGRQILAALPTDLAGVEIAPAPELVALSASRTGPVHCHRVQVDRQWLLAGPAHDVMKLGTGANTGGLQTSALALGLARAAVGYLEKEAQHRANLAEPTLALREELSYLAHALLALAQGRREGWSATEVRSQANSLVLRATQAALAAAKGAGFVASHPVGRWCRQALFFLVWSCPQTVLAANLCELAGIDAENS
jgi:alkylation response protein AidB-like acyl-CoA dehydrogenase